MENDIFGYDIPRRDFIRLIRTSAKAVGIPLEMALAFVDVFTQVADAHLDPPKNGEPVMVEEPKEIM
jgi:hypothetical protein